MSNIDLTEQYKNFGISKEVLTFCNKILEELQDRFKGYDEIKEYNQLKVINAMQEARLSEAHFAPTTGYGYNDIGREALEKIYANVFNTEDALVRPQITCGTHALGIALAANLRPGDELLSISGKPYDTLEEVIGIRPAQGSLKEYGVSYSQVELKENGDFDKDAIKNAINDKTRVIAIQRSKGYMERKTLSPYDIGDIIHFVKDIKPEVIVMVDNCYGEFVNLKEPSDFGADMTVGSLIKNPGGGLAPVGGYIAGTKECVERCSYRLTTPGLGREVGPTLGVTKDMIMGLFMAPSVVNSALKGAVFAAAIYEKLGFKVVPAASEKRFDIIQAIQFGNPEGLISFCQGIQAGAPVDSFVVPEPWAMPGYDSDVIMAAGTFVSGASIELSADGPLREPYTAYFQGGLTFEHAKLGIIMSLQKLVSKKIVTID